MLFGLASRETLDISVLHDRSPLYVTLADGSIRNGYTLKILNKAREGRAFGLSFEAPSAAAVQVVGSTDGGAGDDGTAGMVATLRAGPDSVATYRVYVTLPRTALSSETTPVSFVLTERQDGGDGEGGERVVKETVFRGPPA
jgi:polyferredoxin